MRILLTENCNARCPNCFNAEYREKRDMEIDDLIKVSKMLYLHGNRDIKIMGGEPTVHKSFFEAIEILRSYFESTNLFTNALNDAILNYRPRETDTITYNFNFFGPNFDSRKFLLDAPGERHLEIQITSTVNTKFLIEKIKRVISIFDGYKNLQINFTLNCMENIFLSKAIIIEKWNEVIGFAEENNIPWGIDHIIPKCFYEGTNMILPEDFGICTPECAGLINSKLELLFCNQHPVVLHRITDCTETREQIRQYLCEEFLKKQSLALNNKCFDCENYNKKCNGGCFVHKQIYSL